MRRVHAEGRVVILPSERHFNAGLAKKLERAAATLSAEAFRLYLLGMLAADSHGRIPEAAMDALDD